MDPEAPSPDPANGMTTPATPANGVSPSVPGQGASATQGHGDSHQAPDVPGVDSGVSDPGPFFHGTKADLQLGDRLEPGRRSNFGEGRAANFVYLTATLDAAIWGAELAAGDGPGRIYHVEPTGPLEDDPNLTNTRFPGNPTRSYRTRDAIEIIGEVVDWEGHPPEVLQHMRDHLADLKRRGIEAIND